MSVKLEGKHVVKQMREAIISRVTNLKRAGFEPAILIIRVGEREDDISYEKSILKNCERLGIKSSVTCLSEAVDMDTLKSVLSEANQNDLIHGIMLFRPLPPHLDQEEISQCITPEKDIDCMSPVNLERVFEGKSDGFVPCTPKAAIEVLKFYDIPLNGANVAVAGRSLVVGKPLAMLLLDENATVTVCHSKTKDMAKVTSNAEIVFAAIGKAKFMTEKFFRPESIVIDIGINDDGNGKICGDVDFDNVADGVAAITPAIGGVGAVTTTILLDNVVIACEKMATK